MSLGGNVTVGAVREGVNESKSKQIRKTPRRKAAKRDITQFLHTLIDHAYSRKHCLAALFCVFLPLQLQAQQRPLLTEDPRLIPNGAVVTELGFGYARDVHYPLSGLQGNEFSALVSGLHVSLGPHAEFQVGSVMQKFLKANGEWRNDWGDSSISTKIRIVPETPRIPIISFRPTVVLPNSNDARGIDTNSMNFFGSLLVGKTIGRAFVYGNAGLGILTDTVRVREQQDVMVLGIAGVLPITSRIRLLSEWSGLKNPLRNPSPGTESRGQVRVGMQFLTGSVRLDVAGTTGTTRLDHSGGVVFGMTKEFQLWK
jgi:hypothetical protein